MVGRAIKGGSWPPTARAILGAACHPGEPWRGLYPAHLFRAEQVVDDQERAVNMLHWLHSLLPHIPHYGYVLVFIVVFLNNLGVPLPGETILLGAGFILGKAAGSLWEPMVAGTAASFRGGSCSFWLGRRLGKRPPFRPPWVPTAN